MTLAAAERKLGVAEKLAAVICDPRDPLRVVHLLPDILRARIFAIAFWFILVIIFLIYSSKFSIFDSTRSGANYDINIVVIV